MAADEKKKGALFINLTVQAQKSNRPDKKNSYNNSYFYHDVDPGKIILVSADFDRRDGCGRLNGCGAKLDSHCSKAFNFTENENNFQILLTDAVHLCLDRPFHNN
jgi:hypothetical protein